MTKRGKAWAGAGIAIWGTAMTAALFVMRDANQSSQRIEAMRPAPVKAVPTTSSIELHEAIRASGDPPPETLRLLPPNADVNRDGRIELDDILLVMHAFSSPDECNTPCPADICCSGEHRVDLDDLLAVLTAFNSPCDTDICPRCGPPPTGATTKIFEVFLDGRWVRAKPARDGTHYVDKSMTWRCRKVPASEQGE